MFVYNKGKLVKNVIPISQDEFIFRLTHVTSGMTIEVNFDNENKVNNNPYKVYKEVNGSYVIYEEFYKKNKTVKENFEEAILFFEDNIYKELGETPPVEGTPNTPPETPPETFQEVPIVGDIIRVGNKYGIVTDIIDTQVVTKQISKEEAMRILQNQKNAQISISQSGNTSDDLDFEIPSFDDGGSLSSTVIFDTQKDKIIILRVKPPQTGGTPPPDDGTPPPPPEPQPDNVEDPTEKTPPQPKSGDDEDGKDKDGEDKDGKDKDGEDKGGEDKGGEDKGGEDKGGEDKGGDGEDGDGEDGDGKGGEDQDGKQGGNNKGEGADGEFGDDDDMQSLEEMLKKIKEDFDRGKTTKDIQNQQDLDSLANALSVPKDQIKNIFKTKSIVMSAIGRRNIFGTDNEQRLNDTLNEIFK
jgi:hypothetical protein